MNANGYAPAERTQGGYWVWDEGEGCSVHRWYGCPYMVIAKGTDFGGKMVVTSFRTREEAERYASDPKYVGWYGPMTVENWNE